jgi:uncharacterized membrane protein YhaH (DUF805 family)
MFTLFHLLISFVLGFIEGFVGVAADSDYSVFATIYMLATLLPAFGVTVRRLHDTGRSGWWIWLSAVPFIGWMVVFIFLASGSDEGDNEYGASPMAFGEV